MVYVATAYSGFLSFKDLEATWLENNPPHFINPPPTGQWKLLKVKRKKRQVRETLYVYQYSQEREAVFKKKINTNSTNVTITLMTMKTSMTTTTTIMKIYNNNNDINRFVSVLEVLSAFRKIYTSYIYIYIYIHRYLYIALKPDGLTYTWVWFAILSNIPSGNEFKGLSKMVLKMKRVYTP